MVGAFGPASGVHVVGEFVGRESEREGENKRVCISDADRRPIGSVAVGFECRIETNE